MWFFALATDYDGTIATHGGVDEPTLAALERLRKTGRKLILVTGRQLDELLTVFPRVDLFDWVVAENGALLYRPSDKLEKSLAKGPPPEFVSRLQSRGVERIACGRAIVATWEPWENVVLDTIREQGLELQVIFNKGAVMILPSGVNKSTGLAAALQEMRLSAHNVAAVGDAENDHALLHSCEVGVAVANALPALKDAADWVASQGHGAGVAELIDNIIDNDLRMLDGQLQRHDLLLGHRETDATQGNGHASPNEQTSHQVAAEPRTPITGVVPITDEPSRTEVRLSPRSGNLLVLGPAGGGKTTFTAALLERLHQGAYQYCLIDPKGNYRGLEQAISVGAERQMPTADEVLQILDVPSQNVAVHLQAIPSGERADFFLSLLVRLQEMRARTGRPHWIVVDRAHYVLPPAWNSEKLAALDRMERLALVTYDADQIAASAVNLCNTVIALGHDPARTLGSVCERVGCEAPPAIDPRPLRHGEALLWRRDRRDAPVRFHLQISEHELKTVRQKYLAGELTPEHSFYFRGPAGKLNLRAQNLQMFLQLAEGVDDETWLYHFVQHDYSSWFRHDIHDNELAAALRALEQTAGLSAEESRAKVRDLIARHYQTAPPGEELMTTGR